LAIGFTGGTSRFGPAKVSLVRRSDGAVVYTKVCVTTTNVALIRDDLQDKLDTWSASELVKELDLQVGPT